MRTVRLGFVLVCSLALAAPVMAAPRPAAPAPAGFLALAFDWLVAAVTGSSGAVACGGETRGPRCVSPREEQPEPEWVARKGCAIDPNGNMICWS